MAVFDRSIGETGAEITDFAKVFADFGKKRRVNLVSFWLAAA